MSIRTEKIGSLIRRIVSETLLREVSDPRIDGLVSITKVEVTADLREARVYVSLLGNKNPAPTVLEGLRSATHRFHRELKEQLTMRTVPHVSFHLDESLKKEADVLRKIDEAMGRVPPSEPAADPAADKD